MDGASAVQPPALIRIALVSSDLGDLGPLSLRVGQRLLAEVLAVQAETGRTILSLAGRRVEAQVPAGLRQGEIVRVAVAEVLPDRLVFRVEPETGGASMPVASGRAASGNASPGPSIGVNPAALPTVSVPPALGALSQPA